MKKVPSELERLVFSTQQSDRPRKALPVQVSHTFGRGSAVFDEDNLVSCAGLVPVMALAEQAGLSRLLDNNIHLTSTRVKSGAANPAPKLLTLIASMCAGADYIDDVDLVRAGGMKPSSTGCMPPPRWEPCCASSPSVTPANSTQCSPDIWPGYASE